MDGLIYSQRILHFRTVFPFLRCLWNEGNFLPSTDNKGIRRIIGSECSEKFALGVKNLQAEIKRQNNVSLLVLSPWNGCCITISWHLRSDRINAIFICFPSASSHPSLAHIAERPTEDLLKFSVMSRLIALRQGWGMSMASPTHPQPWPHCPGPLAMTVRPSCHAAHNKSKASSSTYRFPIISKRQLTGIFQNEFCSSYSCSLETPVKMLGARTIVIHGIFK